VVEPSTHSLPYFLCEEGGGGRGVGHGRLSLQMYDMIGFIIGVKSLCSHFCAFCLESCRFVLQALVAALMQHQNVPSASLSHWNPSHVT